MGVVGIVLVCMPRVRCVVDGREGGEGRLFVGRADDAGFW